MPTADIIVRDDEKVSGLPLPMTMDRCPPEVETVREKRESTDGRKYRSRARHPFRDACVLCMTSDAGNHKNEYASPGLVRVYVNRYTRKLWRFGLDVGVSAENRVEIDRR